MKVAIRKALVATFIVAVFVAVTPAQIIIEQVLLKVNGEIFTKTELETRQASALRSLGRDTSKPSDAELRKMLSEITPQLMVAVVNEMVLIQRGKELGYTLGDEQFKSIVDNIKNENKWTEEAFQAALKQENISMVELRRNLERQMMMSNVTRNEIQAKITVSQEEMRKFYEAHIKEFSTSPAVTLREVLIVAPTGDGSSPAEVAAKARADAVRTRALAGESFDKLASEVSESPSRANGGLIGPLSLDDIAPQVRQSIDPLKVGEFTPVLRTSGGYQILKLESTTPRETKPFDEAKEQINERVYSEKERSETLKHLEKLRQQSIIEWKSPELQKAYEAGLQQLKTAPPTQ